MICEPVFDYGRTPADWSLVDGRHTADATGDGLTIRLQSSMPPRHRGRLGPWPPSAAEGRAAVLLFAVVAEELVSPPDCRRGRRASFSRPPRYWRGWHGRARLPDHRYREAVERSTLTIKGLTYMPTGATVAALTTSLPETPGGERNWDYRFTWMRDSTFTLQALHFLNLDWEADEFMQFVADLEPNSDGALQIMYGIDGRRDLTGVPARGPLGLRRRQAGANRQRGFDQRQNDVFGAVLGFHSAPHPAQRSPSPPTVADRAESGQVPTAVWQNPDQGIWEARGEPATT